jgi:hypothetical protein
VLFNLEAAAAADEFTRAVSSRLMLGFIRLFDEHLGEEAGRGWKGRRTVGRGG